MGIYTVNASIKQTFTLAIMKKDLDFFLSFILHLKIFVNFTPFSITGPATYSFIHRYNDYHLHS